MPGLRWVDYKDEPFLWQIGLARLRSIKLLELGQDAQTIQEMMVYTALMQKQAGRMARAVRKQHHIKTILRRRLR